MDLCSREAQKENFFCMINGDASDHLQGIESERRIVTQRTLLGAVNHGLPSNSVARSFVSHSRTSAQFAYGCRLLRVFKMNHEYSLADILGLFNARLLLATTHGQIHMFPSLMSLLWNLETLIVRETDIIAHSGVLAPEIWELRHLRHVVFTGKVELLDPVGAQTDCVLENLQTLSVVKNFKITDGIVKRIPNLMKLGVFYNLSMVSESEVSRFFNSVSHLHKLEALKCEFTHDVPTATCVFNELETLTFAPSLKELTLTRSFIPWENMRIVGSLKNLEILKLQCNAFSGNEWCSTDGEFQKLSFLSIDTCNLVTWQADPSHFPVLKCLYLRHLRWLKAIPLSIGEIDTLQFVELKYCRISVINSAKEIQDERKVQGNDDILIEVTDEPEAPHREELKRLEDFNFHVLFTRFDDPLDPTKWLSSVGYNLRSLYIKARDVGPDDRELQEIISKIANDMAHHAVEYAENEREIEHNREGATIMIGHVFVDRLFYIFDQHLKDQSSKSNRFKVSWNHVTDEMVQYFNCTVKLEMGSQIRYLMNARSSGLVEQLFD